MDEQIKTTLDHLYGALAEVRASLTSCDEKLTQIELVLGKQNLPQMQAGEIVVKTYCEKSHKSLLDMVVVRNKQQSAFMVKVVAAAFLIFSLILGGFGVWVKAISDRQWDQKHETAHQTKGNNNSSFSN